MSRATSIWVILDEQKSVIACFTVRHEMVSWLNRQDSVVGWQALRVPDNPTRYLSRPAARFAAKDLLTLGDNERV